MELHRLGGRIFPTPFLFGDNMIELGDVVNTLQKYDDDTFSGCFCDPPYGLNFMGKKWDGQVPDVTVWKEVYRVLKSGSMLLAFGGTRTWHRLAVAIEDAGFEIRDTVMWVYGTGFPKSHNIGKSVDEWEGYGTALKPAYEPIVMAMKPIDGSFSDNVKKHGVGGINIDASRIPTTDSLAGGSGRVGGFAGKTQGGDVSEYRVVDHDKGRWPANFMHDGSVDFPESRFFYCAKANKKERNEGIEHNNNHPTVKPIALCEYLAKMILPPNEHKLLVPFSGSGSEVIGALKAGWKDVTGIEISDEYVEIAKARIEHHCGKRGLEKFLS